MNYKNYIKQAVKISTLLPKVFKQLKKKNGGILLDIKLNWENILDANLNSVCFAHSLKKVNNKNILTISSDQNNILELSYSSDTIKEKINKFYNSPIIDEIKFKKFLQN